jgi:hypothetical protein
MGGVLFMPGSGVPQTVMSIRERSGRSWNWVPDRRIVFGTSIPQEIIADFNRYVARNRGIGTSLAYEVPAAIQPSEARWLPMPALAFDPPMQSPRGQTGTAVLFQPSNPPVAGVKRSSGVESLYLGLVTLGILLGLDVLRGTVRVPLPSGFASLLPVAPQIGGFVAGFFATFRMRRLPTSLLTGTIVGVGAVVLRILFEFRYIEILGTELLRRQIYVMIELAVMVVALAVAGGMLAAFLNLFRRRHA